MEFLQNKPNEEIKLMFEQDIATICRQAIDLRHPIFRSTNFETQSKRCFMAAFTEKLSDSEHTELKEQLLDTWPNHVWSIRLDDNVTEFCILFTTDKLPV